MQRTAWRTPLIAGTVAALVLAHPIQAQGEAPADIAAMRAQIAELKGSQAALAQRIAELEAALGPGAPARAGATPPPARTGGGGGAPALAAVSPSALPSAAPPTHSPPLLTVGSAPSRGAAAPVNAAGGSAPGAQPAVGASRLALSGDLRVRYEDNTGSQVARDRDRTQLRARLRATYTATPWLTIGGQLTTGDPGDPNSADATLGGFDNDLQIALDQLWLRGTFGRLSVTGGKIPQLFARTELVWDGDVSPEGVEAIWRQDLGGGTSLRAHAMYYIVDEAPLAEDSHIVGGQLQFERVRGPFGLELAAAYYDYRLRSVANADAGDFRTNRVLNGRYLSDFNLLDVVGAVRYTGLGERWPLRVVGDYVHNFGATTDQDTGFGVDVLVGRGIARNDWRFGYGYAQTGVDAVFAAFSHDNTDLATNYVQHTLFAEYVVVPHTVLNATFYHYRPKSARFTQGFLPGDWLNRMRVSLMVAF